MKKYVQGFWYSMPLQLLLLHFKRNQFLLLFWYILFATVSGNFMKNFGADSLFLAPEYYNSVSFVSTAFVGFALGIFIMSWNITTFILQGKYIKFLVTTSQPFLKYCINNALLPIIFLGFYCSITIKYSVAEELLSKIQIVWLTLGFLGGFCLSVLIAFLYFFGADKTIYYSMGSKIKSANTDYDTAIEKTTLPNKYGEVRIDWFFSARLHLRKPRDVRHYNDEFLETVFKRHHFAAAVAIILAFLGLVGLGFISNQKLFQFPAAACITVSFAVFIALAGAFTIFFKHWSLIILTCIYIVANFLYQNEVIDPRNKAYGLNYDDKKNQPVYDANTIRQLVNQNNIARDKSNFIGILNKWKANQKSDKPVMYIINTSGGGLRSATFTMNILQSLDKELNGELMRKTLFINGSSGGILGAAYFRELYYKKQHGATINLQDKKYVTNISNDLLNPLFSSFISRDIMGPVQKFLYNKREYIKDRGYAFEEKLNENLDGILDKRLGDYVLPESTAEIPFMFFNSVIVRDGRKIIMSSNPARFMMASSADSGNAASIDAIDFVSYFNKQDALNIRMLSALRMSATFPYVLPSVLLPTADGIDVMDGGIRDNFGAENTLRFLNVFSDWLKQNVSKIIVLQINDRNMEDWEKPTQNIDYFSFLTKPFSMLQNNWFNLQHFYQQEEFEYFGKSYGKDFYHLCWQYEPAKSSSGAALSFHLTNVEKRDISASIFDEDNKRSFQALKLISAK